MKKFNKNIINFTLIFFIYIFYILFFENQRLDLKLLFLFVNSLVFLKLYSNLNTEYHSIDFTFLLLLVISIPISFRSILGDSFGNFPLNWFYIFLFAWFIKVIINGASFNTNFFFLIILLLSSLIIPLILSDNFYEGLKEYLSYSSFLIGVFIASNKKKTIDNFLFEVFKNYYMYVTLLASIGFIIQYIFINFLNIPILGYDYYAGGRILIRFLFGDISGATVYVGTGIIFLILSSLRFKNVLILIMSISIALTSSRTGLFSLLLTLILLFLITKSLKGKFISFVLFAVITLIGFNILFFTRSNIEDLFNLLFDDRGRFSNINNTLSLLYNNYVFGYGLDLGYFLQINNMTVAHNVIIHLMGQTGIFITFGFLYLLYRIGLIAILKGEKNLILVYVMSMISSLVIPGFFNMRFFTVVTIVILLLKREKVKYEN
jgi:hypothetical protein